MVLPAFHGEVSIPNSCSGHRKVDFATAHHEWESADSGDFPVPRGIPALEFDHHQMLRGTWTESPGYRGRFCLGSRIAFLAFT